MAKSNARLELTWIGKENRPKLEPRVLLEDLEKSHHALHRVTDNDIFDNMLIHPKWLVQGDTELVVAWHSAPTGRLVAPR